MGYRLPQYRRGLKQFILHNVRLQLDIDYPNIEGD